MAKLVKRSTSPFWYARFQVDGKDRWLSTGKSKKDEAEKELKRLLAHAKGETTIDEQAAALVKLLEGLPADRQAGKRQEVVRALFTTLEAHAGLVSNPWSHLKTKKKTHTDGRRNLSLEELQTVLGRAQGNLRLMLALCLFTGLRPADVVNLRWADLDFKTGLLKCAPVKTSRFGKIVEIPLHRELLAVLEPFKAAATCDHLFPEERKAHTANASNITRPIKLFFESCGLTTTEKTGHGQRKRAVVRVGFHSLRHSFVSLCAKAGTPLHVVQKLVGHGNPMLTSDVYLHLDHDQKRQAISGLPEVGFGGDLMDNGQKKSASGGVA